VERRGQGNEADRDFTSILAAAQAGEEWAAAALFHDLHPRVMRFLRARDSQIAEDLASEVWVAVATTLGDFVGDERGFRAWVFTIARRRLIDHFRMSSRRRTDVTADETFAELAAPDATELTALERIAGADAAAWVVSVLSPEQADVVLLRVLGDLDAEQVGELMGRSANWVRVTQHRALRKLAERLESQLAVTQ
jgi:RNA polymerase sigma-70 factor (ECF subfamily)